MKLSTIFSIYCLAILLALTSWSWTSTNNIGVYAQRAPRNYAPIQPFSVGGTGRQQQQQQSQQPRDQIEQNGRGSNNNRRNERRRERQERRRSRLFNGLRRNQRF